MMYVAVVVTLILLAVLAVLRQIARLRQEMTVTAELEAAEARARRALEKLQMAAEKVVEAKAKVQEIEKE
jgi:hypothetical protein